MTKVMKVEYPNSKGFADVVHWLDTAYAEETATWSKHANICLKSHEMDMLILLLDTDSIAESKEYQDVIDVFKKAIEKIIH